MPVGRITTTRGLFRAILLLLAPALLFAPARAYASVSFTEIMYDAPGADAGREWVEVHNAGAQTLDLSGWKFFEGNTKHALALVSGGGIAPGGYAVIADDPSKFLADQSGYSGVLFDSSFSLSNSGEPLSLIDDTGATVASVSYDPSLGAAGDGNTLQWDGTKWLAAPATPGAAYAAPGVFGISANENVSANSGAVSGANGSVSAATADALSGVSVGTGTETNGTLREPVRKKIFADAGPDKTVFVDADSLFHGSAFDSSGEPLMNARYSWSFGDGGYMQGQSVSHRWAYPGTYVVVLSVASDAYAAEDRAVITAIPAAISITFASSAVTGIRNDSRAELDLGGWLLQADGKTFTFPERTIVAPGETMFIANERTGIFPSTPEALSLRYPGGAFAASFSMPLVAARMPGSAAPAFAGAAQKNISAAPASAGAAGDSRTAITRSSAASAPPSPASVESQAAAALPATEAAGGGSMFPWLAGLSLIVALGAGTLYFFSGKKPAAADAASASDYVIEEETS